MLLKVAMAAVTRMRYDLAILALSMTASSTAL
jgi:hypothetical protein